MFGEFLKKLTAPQPVKMVDDDARLALGALLVRVALADGTYDDAERAQIAAVLSRRYGLDDPSDLLARCEALEKEAPDTVRFTRAIKDAIDYDNRLSVITALWEVVLADGVRDADEDSMMRMLTSLLGIEDQDSHAARRKVQDSQ
jgi:uncharacterized tellurite resistance protein B-like protein